MLNSTISVLGDPVNLIFMFVMLFLFIFDLFMGKKDDTGISSIIGALGMLGTFVGIFLGLIKFDVNNIEDSVPFLLNGMKLAFTTSIIGLVLSNILKFFKIRYIHKNDIEKQENLSQDFSSENSSRILIEYMKDMRNSIIKSNENFNNSINTLSKEQQEINSNLFKALVGNNEHSLVSNIKLLRTDTINSQRTLQEELKTSFEETNKALFTLVDTNKSFVKEITKGNNILIDEFRSFAKQMASNNMEAFTAAIQACIKDLNSQLQEQFGENFKHLNFAVENLLQWQENYKDTIEKTTALQKNTFDSISKVDIVLKSIANSSKNFGEIAANLEKKILVLNEQESSMTNSLNSLKKISADAVDFIPKINDYVEQVNMSLNKAANDLNKLSQYAFQSMKLQHDNIITSFDGLAKEINNVSQSNIDSIENQIVSIGNAASTLENQGIIITTQISESINNMVAANNHNLQESVKLLNLQLSATLNSSLESLGNQLATVSEKFVKDYIPLTEQLKKLIEVSKR